MKTITLKKAAKKVRKGKAQIENDLLENKERFIYVIKNIFPKDGWDEYQDEKVGFYDKKYLSSQGGEKSSNWITYDSIIKNLPIIKLSSIVDKPKWKKSIEKRLKSLELKVIGGDSVGLEVFSELCDPQHKEEFVVPEKFAFRLYCEEAVEYANEFGVINNYSQNGGIFHYPKIERLGSIFGNVYEGYTDVTEQFKEHIYNPWKKQQEVNLNFDPEKKAELEVGKWYKSYSGVFKFFVSNITAYGFDCKGNWDNEASCYDLNYKLYKWELATTEEITSMLTAECKKRGIVKGAKVKGVNGFESSISDYDLSFHNYIHEEDRLLIDFINVYEKGRFAEVIEPSKEEVKEKESAFEILNRLVHRFNAYSNTAETKDSQDAFKICSEDLKSAIETIQQNN